MFTAGHIAMARTHASRSCPENRRANDVHAMPLLCRSVANCIVCRELLDTTLHDCRATEAELHEEVSWLEAFTPHIQLSLNTAELATADLARDLLA